MICRDGMGLGSGEAPFFEKKTGKKQSSSSAKFATNFKIVWVISAPIPINSQGARW